jgi:hypothetical protein
MVGRGEEIWGRGVHERVGTNPHLTTFLCVGGDAVEERERREWAILWITKRKEMQQVLAPAAGCHTTGTAASAKAVPRRCPKEVFDCAQVHCLLPHPGGLMLRTGVSVPKEEKHLAKKEVALLREAGQPRRERGRRNGKRGVRGSECRV